MKIRLPEEYKDAKEKIEIMQEEMMDQIQIIQQKMITLEDDMEKQLADKKSTKDSYLFNIQDVENLQEKELM